MERPLRVFPRLRLCQPSPLPIRPLLTLRGPQMAPRYQVSTLQTEIYHSTLNSEYVALPHSVRDLIPLKIIIKEVIVNLVMNSEKLEFISSTTVYEDNNGATFVATSPRIITTSNHISVRYHWYRYHVGKEFSIQNIEGRNLHHIFAT